MNEKTEKKGFWQDVARVEPFRNFYSILIVAFFYFILALVFYFVFTETPEEKIDKEKRKIEKKISSLNKSIADSKITLEFYSVDMPKILLDNHLIARDVINDLDNSTFSQVDKIISLKQEDLEYQKNKYRNNSDILKTRKEITNYLKERDSLENVLNPTEKSNAKIRLEQIRKKYGK